MKKSKWYKVEKYFKGGGKTHYFRATDEEDAEEKAKDWGERSDGGHNYGYRLYWEPHEPPKVWLQKNREQQRLHRINIAIQVQEAKERSLELARLLAEGKKAYIIHDKIIIEKGGR